MSRRRQWGEDSTVRIELSGSASVSVAFHGNLFDLSPEERRLVTDLSEVIRAYREAGEVGEVELPVPLEEETHGRTL